MFKPSETANDLFRRLHNRSFDLRSKPDRVEQLPFGIAVDVQCAASDISEFVLGTAVSFATQFEDGIVVHISIGGSLYNALAQSQVNLSHTSLYRLHCDGRVKAIQAPSLVHLLAAFELLKLSLNGEKVLVILEGLSTLFLAHKAKEPTQVHDQVISNTLKSMHSLVNSQFVIAMWVNSVTSKQSPGLRDGPNAARDPLTLAWKQYVPKLVQYSPT